MYGLRVRHPNVIASVLRDRVLADSLPESTSVKP